MAIDKLQLIKTRIGSIKSTLEGNSAEDKQLHVAIQSAENVNKVLADIRDAFPEIADDIPDQIKTQSQFNMLGTVDLKYIDLEILLNQTMDILNLLESGS